MLGSAQDSPAFPGDLRAGAAFVDGQFMPIADARIGITEMGFSRSDVTYDVVSVWDGSFFRLSEHLDRFERSCAALHFHLTHSRTEIEGILTELIRRSGLRRAYVEMIATRGVPLPGQRDPRRMTNRFYAYAIPYVWIVEEQKQEEGTDLFISTIERIPPESIDPKIKNFHWGDLVRAMYEGFDHGAENVVLVDRDGNVTEGPGFNVFAWYDGALRTPCRGVLEGITRRMVLELARKDGIPAREELISRAQLERADEVFLTSTAGGVMPVKTVNGRSINSMATGSVTRRIRQLYWEAHDQERYTSAVVYSPEHRPQS